MDNVFVGIKPGSFETVSLFGEDGIGVMYEACQTFSNRTTTINVLSLTFNSKPRFVKRFQRETTAAGLIHPNILHVRDITAEEAPFTPF